MGAKTCMATLIRTCAVHFFCVQRGHLKHMCSHVLITRVIPYHFQGDMGDNHTWPSFMIFMEIRFYRRRII